MPRNSKARSEGQSRARKRSDDVYNTRRRLKREIARINAKPTATAAERRFVADLARLARETYKKPSESAREYASRTAAVVSAANAQTAFDKKSAQARANKVFQNEMRNARAGLESTSVGRRGSFKVSAFYAATREIWQGLPPAQRNRAIMAHFGVGSLQEVFDIVMDMPAQRQAVTAYERISDSEEWTNEQEEFYSDSGDSDNAYSNAILYAGLN